MPHTGFSESGTSLANPYGGLSQGLAGRLATQELQPLLNLLGFGPQAGSAKAGRQEARLAGATGPLAGLIRDVRGFAGDVIPNAEAIGREVSARGSASFEQLQQQIQQALGATSQGLGYAQRFATEAFSPTADQPLFQEASRRMLDTIRPGLAARGIEGGGAGGRAESDATRDLAFQFAQGQRGNEQAAIPLLQQAGIAGIAPAQTGMESVGALGQLLQQQFGIPMQAVGNLLNILTAGQAGSQQLIGATGPVPLPHSKGMSFS